MAAEHAATGGKVGRAPSGGCRYEREAALANITWPRQTPELCQLLAEATDQPWQYLAALREENAPLDLFHPFLVVVARRHPRGWQKVVDQLLDDERVRQVAVNVCLTVPVGDRLTEKAVELCDGRMTNLLQYFPTEKLNPEAHRPLLEHPDVNVAQAAVIGLRPAPGEDTSDDLGQSWEVALVRCPADDHWYAEILKHRPDLLMRWVLAWNERLASDPSSYERLPEAMLLLIGSLEIDARIDLLERITPNGFNPWLDQVVAAAVGGDDRSLRALLSRRDLGNHHRAALAGLPDERWFERAVIMLDAGSPPAEIVASCIPTMSAWSGDESDHWNQYVEAFAPFVEDRDPRRAAIARAGIDCYRSLVEKATERERREAVYGLK